MNRTGRRSFLLAALATGVALATPVGRAFAATPPTVDGSLNLRDIGGYPVGSSSVVRRGLVYRSGTLSLLTDKGVGQLAALGLTEVVDFRTASEVATQGPDRLPAGVKRVSTPIGDPPAAAAHLATGSPDPKQLAIYQGYVSNASWRAGYADTVRRLLDGAQRPMLYHDSAGAHRAGWLTAVLFTTIGMSKAQVYAEYLESNDALGGTYAYPEYLDAAFARADQDFGSFHDFLTIGLGLTPPQITRLSTVLLTSA
ncbi:tyrosine-protein phosphatase [Kutzneria sp. NPDC052558]|uniref:tyrosine-protein phosphatase n=1 Tax=Kutzneria sp. NPDC052558 TaxID=3364121 RepID=UPI0037CAA52D